jgi:hypothetical protein
MTLMKPLLSVCAFCNDVRDPLGRWTYINHKLLDWLEYRLSHGICPDCVRGHFPEFADHILEKKEPTKENSSQA